MRELFGLNDPLLAPLLLAGDADERERQIERLFVTVTLPLAERIVSRFAREEGAIHRQDADDIVANVGLCLVRKLRAIAKSAEEAVPQFENYVAKLTYNAVNDYLRRRYPERTRLKNRIRYVLTHDARLASWNAVAGLAEWRGSEDLLTSFTLERGEADRKMLDSERTADAVVAILRRAGRPMPVNALIEVAARLWNVVDARVVKIEHADRASDQTVLRLETRDFLRALWREIQLLPAAQRKALLLNLRDSEAVNVVSLFVLTGVVPAEEIAAALEMSLDELSSIWNELPFDDLRTADLLKVSRQQVINLRKSARQRLGRRLFGRKG